MAERPMKDDTVITTAGRDPEQNFGVVNPPIYRASTILYPTVEALESQPLALNGVRDPEVVEELELMRRLEDRGRRC